MQQRQARRRGRCCVHGRVAGTCGAGGTRGGRKRSRQRRRRGGAFGGGGAGGCCSRPAPGRAHTARRTHVRSHMRAHIHSARGASCRMSSNPPKHEINVSVVVLRTTTLTRVMLKSVTCHAKKCDMSRTDNPHDAVFWRIRLYVWVSSIVGTAALTPPPHRSSKLSGIRRV